ncbi:hypothetical protein B7495_09210 [Cryobacterium sp. LW097]|uniref:hypothetical protein n=1 Tax=unclassified Cryobacterium TaxID=2649013 RepID=UPI000B4D57E6|nr:MULTISPECIES: hypothetical protein [unclassified Cryobacterium]ASD22252.1 hypothetical protein B7495_09210 [Cryobacterium sp. LW097]TFC55590.1 hypothetical protein E3O68_06170 [Cryobacterium sp. TMB3-1-2]TFC72854.1 hypothetical protein E3T21_05365 [Cryobacterium sp. TMB3-15]TFC76360.1 hypothetical protein E3T22_10505 [Cryobacterium sp. TMB3-10]TFC88528.1 hypothetical protein E3T19_09695 [Cryobacterium sp. TMT4-31]
MTPLLPAALTPADLPLAELNCARLDGELFPLAGAWCPVDAHDGPETRGEALTSVAPSRAAAERMSAAWIYGLAAEPDPHQFCIDMTARARKPVETRTQLREVRLGRDDTRVLGRQLVTTPLRTAIDLARWGRSPGCRADTALLAALLVYDGPVDPHADEQALAGQRGVSFSRRAAAQLREARRLNLSRR